MSNKIVLELDPEELYFKNKERERIKALRETAEKEKNELYCEEHQYHCFRCGTKSLAEVKQGNVTIDVCVNEDCGAIHLDPGEIEAILKENKTVIRIQQSIFNVFK